MAVRVTRDCRVSYQYALHDLAEGQEVPSGEFADYLLGTGAPVLEVDAGTGDTDGDGVPDGTAAEVRAWVGDDPGRAAAALMAEQRRDKPRTTLAAELSKLAGDLSGEV
jgi:hypothetical protein